MRTSRAKNLSSLITWVISSASISRVPKNAKKNVNKKVKRTLRSSKSKWKNLQNYQHPCKLKLMTNCNRPRCARSPPQTKMRTKSKMKLETHLKMMTVLRTFMETIRSRIQRRERRVEKIRRGEREARLMEAMMGTVGMGKMVKMMMMTS